ncbi:MAG: phosphatidylserine decarboxylase [Bacteroidales bacterium]|nr:phosphatidylserine decarboxylase [Bacteroidales bacterium]
MRNQNLEKRSYRNSISRLAGNLAKTKWPKFILKPVIRIYCKNYSIYLEDYKIPTNGFKTFNEFFTRKIKPELRPISEGIVSPVDGTVYDFGIVNNEKKIFVKNQYFSIQDLLQQKDNKFESFAVLYLSPSNYHRVHAPFDFKINRIKYIPGNLRSVREDKVQKTDNLYCKNERIVLYGDSEYGEFAFAFIGAMIVGKIKLSFEQKATSNIKKACCTELKYDKTISIIKGDELGYFELGSSVIILLDNPILSTINLCENSEITLGQKLI